MSGPLLKPTKKHRVLLVDDEEDVHLVTRMSLKGLRFQDRRMEFLSAMSGQEALEIMRTEPNIAVVLLDVVMETDHAGLDVCRAIRGELENPFVRILLRTGQPGAAPEKKVIQEYDIDGYLPKGELTSTRLFTAVRTALKTYYEIVELERYRRNLAAIHDCVVSLHAYEPIETTLERLLGTVTTICPVPLAVLQLETFEEEGNPQQYFLYRSQEDDAVAAEAAAEHVAMRVAAESVHRGEPTPRVFEDGFLVPLRLDHELGYGWIYLQEPEPDEIIRHSLPLLAAHGANAIYSAVTHAMLSNREGDLFDQMQI
ncbi:MAG: response regulator [Acidobacteriota bacterium]